MAPQRKERTTFQLTHEDRMTIKKLEMLTAAVEKVYPTNVGLMWRSFLQGLFVALGGTVGLAIVFAILTFIFSQLTHTPFINTLLQQTQLEKVLPTAAP